MGDFQGGGALGLGEDDGGVLLESEEQLLQALAALLNSERAALRLETEGKLRAAFTAPLGERRTLIEAQRQKWRALEESVRTLSQCIKGAASLDDPEEQSVRNIEAKQSIEQLRQVAPSGLRDKVRLLLELTNLYKARLPGKPETEEDEKDVEPPGWALALHSSKPKAPKKMGPAAAADALESPAAPPGPTEQPAVPQVPAEENASDMRKKQVFSSKLKDAAAQDKQAALKKESEETKRDLKKVEDEMARLKQQQSLANKMKGAAGKQRQEELQRQIEEANIRKKEAEQKGKFAGKMHEALQRQQQAKLASEHEQWQKDRVELVEKFREKQLMIAIDSAYQREHLLAANRQARVAMYQSQFFSEVDVQRINTAKHLCMRTARIISQRIDEDAADAVGRVRDGLSRSQQRLEQADAMAAITSGGQYGVTEAASNELKVELDKSLGEITKYKGHMDTLIHELAPDIADELLRQTSASAATVTKIGHQLRTERQRMEDARSAAAERVHEAERRLDKLTGDDIGVEVASRWATKVNALAEDKRLAEKRRKEMQARIEGRLNADAEADFRRAQAASASGAVAAAAAAAAAEVERARAAEDERVRVEAALREAEQQRLVPVRLKLPGVKMSHIPDKEAFEKMFAEKVRATLDLDESQLRIIEISSGTG